MQLPVSTSVLNERLFNLHAKAHQTAAKTIQNGAFDLCKAFLPQISCFLKEMKSKELAMQMQKNCTPNKIITNNLIVGHNQCLFNAILLAKLFDKFAGGFDFPLKQPSNGSQKVRLIKSNFLLSINNSELEFLQLVVAAKFEPSAFICDNELLSILYCSEITKFTVPEKADKNPNFHIYSIKNKESKESINFAYDKRKNEILGVKHLGYKPATDYIF